MKKKIVILLCCISTIGIVLNLPNHMSYEYIKEQMDTVSAPAISRVTSDLYSIKLVISILNIYSFGDEIRIEPSTYDYSLPLTVSRIDDNGEVAEKVVVADAGSYDVSFTNRVSTFFAYPDIELEFLEPIFYIVQLFVGVIVTIVYFVVDTISILFSLVFLCLRVIGF